MYCFSVVGFTPVEKQNRRSLFLKLLCLALASCHLLSVVVPTAFVVCIKCYCYFVRLLTTSLQELAKIQNVVLSNFTGQNRWKGQAVNRC